MRATATTSPERLSAAGLVLAYGLVGFTAPFTPMHTREYLAAHGPAMTERLHLVNTAVAMVFMFAAMGSAAVAFSTRFRVYSIATIALSLGLGGWGSRMAPQLEANLPTPWMGALERACITVSMAWVVVFALALLRRAAPVESEERTRSASKRTKRSTGRRSESRIAGVRAFTRRHPVASFYGLAFTISWGGILVLAAPAVSRASRTRSRGSFRSPSRRFSRVRASQGSS